MDQNNIFRQNLVNYWNNELFWDQYGNDLNYRRRVSVIKGMIPKHVNSILDVGSGKGEIVNTLHLSYRSVAAMDVSLESIKYVKCPSLVGRIEELPFRTGSFDLVLCMEVIEHLPDLEFQRGLCELQRVAKEWLMVGVPFKEHFTQRFTKCPSCGRVFHADAHFRSFHSIEALAPFFPDFRLKEFILTGPKYRRPTRLGMWFQHAFFHSYVPWEPYLVCLHCGFKADVIQKNQHDYYRWVSLKLNQVLSLLNKEEHYWLIATLRKKDFELH